MVYHPSTRLRFGRKLLLPLLVATLLCETRGIVRAAEEPHPNPPELRLSLREAIQAAIDNNVNVRLLKELKVTKHAVMAMVLLGGTMFELGMWRFRRQLA